MRASEYYEDGESPYFKTRENIKAHRPGHYHVPEVVKIDIEREWNRVKRAWNGDYDAWRRYARV